MAQSTAVSPSVSGTAFSDVDGSDDPQARVRYLDLVTRSTDYKRESLLALALPPGSRVLDVGCGTGDDARVLAELVGPTGSVVGLDPSATMIAEAQRRGNGGGQTAPVEFRRGDVYALPFPDDSFDATRADRVFQHLLDPLAALAELRRVTRPGGVVSVIDTAYETLVLDVPNRALFYKIRSHFLEAGAGLHIACRLFGLFHAAGLRDVRVASTALVALTDYAIASQMGGMGAVGAAAFAAGAITADEHIEWQDTLRELRETGPFFGTFGVVGIVGTVP